MQARATHLEAEGQRVAVAVEGPGSALPTGWRRMVFGTALVSVPLFLWGDRAVALIVDRHLGDGTRAFFVGVSEFGEATWYVVATLVAVAALHALARLPALRGAAASLRAWARYGHLVLASLAVSGLAVNTVKPLLGRLRPRYLVGEGRYGLEPLNFDFGMNSFPSGHSQTVWVLATVVVLAAAAAARRRGAVVTAFRSWPLSLALAAAGAVLGAALVAASRVLVNAHFVTDVIAGSLLGVLTTLWLAPRVLRRSAPA